MMNRLDLGTQDGVTVVFGGVYGNLEALLQFLAVMKNSEIEPHQIIHTGDIAAYGANPEECAELLRSFGCHSIKGYIEEKLANNEADLHCGYGADSLYAQLSPTWYDYTNKAISDETRAWMGALPQQISFTKAGYKCVVTHGGLRQIDSLHFPSTERNILIKELAAFPDIDAVISGHTAIPMMRLPGEKLWHNPGAIGLPANDGTQRGWFSILYPTDEGQICIDLQSINYDWQQAADKMREANLSKAYAKTLETGLIPNMKDLPIKEQAVTGVAIEPRAFLWPPKQKSQ